MRLLRPLGPGGTRSWFGGCRQSPSGRVEKVLIFCSFDGAATAYLKGTCSRSEGYPQRGEYPQHVFGVPAACFGDNRSGSRENPHPVLRVPAACLEGTRSCFRGTQSVFKVCAAYLEGTRSVF